MSWNRLVLAALLGVAMASTAMAHGGVSIGIGVGLPIYPRPWCGGPYYYPYGGYYYRPVYYAAPVVVQPAPVFVPQPVAVQPAPVVQQAVTPTVAPPPANTVV